jgi:serine/threonine protein kinase
MGQTQTVKSVSYFGSLVFV